MPRFRTATLLLSALATACAPPLEGRIAGELVEAGLPQPIARCMAERWADRLSIVQLRKIAELTRHARDESGRITVGRFVTRVRALDDPEIVQVVTRSSVYCALTA